MCVRLISRILLSFLVGVMLGAQAAPVRGQEAVGAISPFQRLITDETGLTLDLVTPDYRATRVTGPDAQPYLQLEIPGFIPAGAAGQPDLPAYSALLAAPPGATWVLETEVLADRRVVLDAPVWPAAAYAASEDWAAPLPGDGAAWLPEVQQRFVLDGDAYAAHTFAPDALVRVEDAGYLRDVRVARLTVTPLLYRAATRELWVIEQARIRVRFEGGAAPGTTAQVAADPGGFLDLARQAVLNPDQVAAWRASPRPAAEVRPSADVFEGQSRYRITLEAPGLYRVTYAALAAAGAPVDALDPSQIRVYRGAAELAIEVAGEADGRFDPADEVRFYAERVQSLYTDLNTYWLALEAGAGRRMAQRSAAPQGGAASQAFPATRYFEEDRIYRSNLPVVDVVDRWFWGHMFVINTTRAPTLTLPFTLEHVRPSGQAAFKGELWGASSDPTVAPDHRVQVYINGAQIGVATWDGVTFTQPQLMFDQALLREGENTLTLYTPGDTGARDNLGRFSESNWANWFTVTYQKAYRATDDRLDFTPPAGATEFNLQGWSAPGILLYDVSDPQSPVRLLDAQPGGPVGNTTLRFADVVPENGHYYAVTQPAMRTPETLALAPVSDLRNPAAGADYLLIAHGDFVAGVSALAQLRLDQGLRVRVIDVQDIYDAFSDGLFDPAAIRDFIEYAYYNWPGPPPSYVLLVGDGTYDAKNNEGYNAKNYIPPFLAYADPILGETAADNRFVTVAGDDLMPDLHLGRLPVNNQAELAAMVNKIVAYERTPAPGAWRNRVVFVADNPDQAGAFGDFSDAAAVLLPPELEASRIYLGTPEFPVNQALRAQQATLDAFNSGALFFNYVGHSSISNWASEQLFGVNVLSQVRNGSQYPIVLPMTCLEGTYHNPRFGGVSESVVRLSNGGAVASWGPTGLGVATGHDYIHKGFYRSIFDAGAYDLGLATTAAKLDLYVNARFPNGTPRFHDLLDTYVLLGDPATRFALPAADLSLEASGLDGPWEGGEPVEFTLRYANVGGARVKGVVVSADLPDAFTVLTWASSDPNLVLRPGPSQAWELAELAPGASGIITVTGQIAAAVAPEALPLRATLQIDSPWLESDRSNNMVGPLELNLLPVDLILAQAVEPLGRIAPGQWLTITLGYANLGQATAAAARLELPLLAALEDASFTVSGPTANLAAGHYAWELAALPPGSKGRITLTGRVPGTLTVDQLTWPIAGQIVARWPDSNTGNNTAPAEVLRVDIGDPFEPDNEREAARRLTVPAFDQPHSYDPVGDRDWVVFRAQAGMRYLIRTVGIDAGGDTLLFLWAGDLLIGKNDDAGSNTRFSSLLWTADADQDYYVMITSTSAIAGFRYAIEIREFPQSVFMPLAVH